MYAVMMLVNGRVRVVVSAVSFIMGLLVRLFGTLMNETTSLVQRLLGFFGQSRRDTLTTVEHVHSNASGNENTSGRIRVVRRTNT